MTSAPEIISRREAKEKGLVHYFTGSPCPKGHLDVRFVSSYQCLSCTRFDRTLKTETQDHCVVCGQELIRNKGIGNRPTSRSSLLCSPECRKERQRVTGLELRRKWREKNPSRIGRPVKERLESNCTYVPESGCWLWMGCWSQAGYGQMRVDGKALLTHRLSWEIYKGPIPPNLFVMHKCDTPACCNPEHLMLGTNADNVADMHRKGRNASARGTDYLPRGVNHHAYGKPSLLRGAKHPKAKLTEAMAIAIYHDTRPPVEIRKEYGVSKTAVYNVKQGRSWSWATGAEKWDG